MCETAPENLNVILQSVRRWRLTQEQVFRLWRCAVKDDDKLVDAVIEKVYQDMIGFNPARAELVMQLIIDRDEAGETTFRGLLQDLAATGGPKAGQSRHHVATDAAPSFSTM
jgi:hypothetical protein